MVLQTSVAPSSPEEAHAPHPEAHLSASLQARLPRPGRVVYVARSKEGRVMLLPSSSWRKAGSSPVAGASGRTRKWDAKDLGQDGPGNVAAAASARLRVGLTAQFGRSPHQARAGELQLL